MARDSSCEPPFAAFGALLDRHLRAGTRPDLNNREPWKNAEFAALMPGRDPESTGAAPNTVANWRKGTALPSEIEPILRALFGGLRTDGGSERIALRDAYDVAARRRDHRPRAGDKFDAGQAPAASGIATASPSGALGHWPQPVFPGVEEPWARHEMATLPAGWFWMGAADGEGEADENEYPRHKVTVTRPFAIGRFAVTFAQWDAARRDGAELRHPDDETWGRADRPVINVGWTDARAYCAWLNHKLDLPPGTYRLPSEAEWEYACRAGTTTPFSFGETLSTEQANYDGGFTYGRGRKGELRGRTVPVGSFHANRWGLHEMHGNVWEWVEDAFGSYPDHRAEAGPLQHAAAGLRFLRGGSWQNQPKHCRSAHRGRWAPAPRGNYAGFRLARSLPSDRGPPLAR